MPETDDHEPANDDSHPSVDSEHFLTKGIDVRVSNAEEGYLCKVRVLALVDIPPSELYAVHTCPDTSNVFRAIDAVAARKVTLDTPDRKEIYVEQTTTVGALWFKRQFITALNVVEHPRELSTHFDLEKPGIMSAFKGSWKLHSVTPNRFRELTANREMLARWHLSLSNPRDNDKTLMEMEQDVCPAIAEKVPPIFYGMLRRVCAKAMTGFFWDATAIAELRYCGVPMDTIIATRVHGKGGLIRRVLCKRERLQSARRNGSTFDGDDADADAGSDTLKPALKNGGGACESHAAVVEDAGVSSNPDSDALSSSKMDQKIACQA